MAVLLNIKKRNLLHTFGVYILTKEETEKPQSWIYQLYLIN